jgi:hypothetical protein
MENAVKFVNEHPKVIGLIFALAVGFAGYNAYKAGMAVAIIHSNVSQAASEALGG